MGSGAPRFAMAEGSDSDVDNQEESKEYVSDDQGEDGIATRSRGGDGANDDFDDDDGGGGGGGGRHRGTWDDDDDEEEESSGSDGRDRRAMKMVSSPMSKNIAAREGENMGMSPITPSPPSMLRSPNRSSLALVCDPYYSPQLNAALVILSPRFDTHDARDLVRTTLLRRLGRGGGGWSVRLSVDRSIPADTIQRLRLVDLHYGNVARYAMEIDPSELVKRKEVNEAEFEKTFGEKWSDAQSAKKICNAIRALSRLGCNPRRLGEAWQEAEHRAPKSYVAWLGPGIHCGLISVGEQSLYVINGFYPQVRGHFISPGAAVHAFGVEWDPAHSADWTTFREKICGCSFGTATAAGDGDSRSAGDINRPRRVHPLSEDRNSLRYVLWERRSELSIDWHYHDRERDEGGAGRDEWDGWDDVLYVAPSPLECLADRCLWLLGGDPCAGYSSPSDDEQYGRTLLGRGLPERKLIEWFSNPLVVVPPPPSYSDRTPVRRHIYDEVRNTDAAECTRKLLKIYDYELAMLERKGAGCRCSVS